jgi:hypothetical protein
MKIKNKTKWDLKRTGAHQHLVCAVLVYWGKIYHKENTGNLLHASNNISVGVNREK